MNFSGVSALFEPLLRASDWVSLASGLPRAVSLIGVTMVAAFIVALFLTALFQPLDGYPVSLVEPPRGRKAALPPAESSAASTHDERAASSTNPPPSRRLVSSATTTSMADAALETTVFTPADLIALGALKARVERGEVTESPLDPRRLAFIRWLVQSGRLAP
ncbi:MAG: hypothetical protein IT307_12500 [Chloroflexi bacterium]|nr:hypothetical protein [Chloroflexota bacterium]